MMTKILIDAGHGVNTPGKRSPDSSFMEWKWNREVAALLNLFLLEEGVKVELVVTENEDISLRERVNRINSVCEKEGRSNVLAVSIHSNAAGNGSAWQKAQGWSCYTSPGQTESDKVADCLYKSFEEEFAERKVRKDFRDGDADWEDNFYILTKTACPAVLLENFFYDNQEECRWLLLQETKKRIARAAAKGILNYLRDAR